MIEDNIYILENQKFNMKCYFYDNFHNILTKN